MRHSNERGSALIFALILMLIISVMAASLMFVARSETWSGMNYKMLTQTRYGAEAGVNAAANFLMYTYVPPATTAGFNTSVYPVTDAAQNKIVLSSISGTQVNYPNSQVVSAFSAATDSKASNMTLSAGNTSLNYTASAQLMSMTQVTPYGSAVSTTIQTWKITAHGDIVGVRNAESEVSAILERQATPAFLYAAFATGGGCGALSFTGNGNTDSYDSSSLGLNASGAATSSPTFQNYGGNVGTNGNQSDSGNNVTINGSLSTPRVGVGACTAGSITALSGSSTSITGGIKELPQAVNLNPPVIPAAGTTNITSSATLTPTCPAASPGVISPGVISPGVVSPGVVSPGVVSPGVVSPGVISPGVTPPSCTPPAGEYGDISLSGQSTVSLPPGVYNINSISLSGQATLQIVPDPVTGLYGPVIINVTGNNNSNPISLSGQGFSNPTYDASMLQFNYAGTGQINIVGNGASAAIVYAPNATASFKGNGAFYGSVVANNVTDVGNGAIHYDRHLQRKLFTLGNYMLGSFSWSKD